MALSWPTGRHGLRIAVILVAGALALVVLPRLMPHDPAPPPPPAISGALAGGVLRFEDAPLSAVLDDVAAITRFRAVAFPDVAARRFTGELDLRRGGRAAVEGLAAITGLELRQAGPHWALVRPAP